jgi:hypothetical protein
VLRKLAALPTLRVDAREVAPATVKVPFTFTKLLTEAPL